MKKNRQYESMTKLKVLGYTVRLWREEPDPSEVDNSDIIRLGKELDDGIYVQPPSAGWIAEMFSTVKRSAAVEVLNQDGNGVLIYPDWH